ncbi:MAG: hypothetical protein ACXV2H_07115 [Actinomycetes bacterium]
MTTLTAGAQLRDAALARALENADDEWKVLALNKIAFLAGTGFTFQAYTLVEHGVPEPDHPSRWGAIFNHAAQAGLIAAAGYGPSARPTVKASACKQWRGVA